jgi:cyclase
VGLVALLAFAVSGRAQVGVVQNIAPDVCFHEGDPRLGTCNNGWVVMNDYVIAVDANYPVGAQRVIPKIRAMTGKPIRFVVDTHFHPDHSFGNQYWADAGATVVAQAATLDELERTGAERWLDSAKERPDVAATHLKLPDLTYTEGLVFKDDRHQVELRWLGIAHTHGDTLVWLPKEKVLFTGDVCVNGSFNYIKDSDVTQWIAVLGKLRALGAVRVCPGHGPIGGPEIIADQQDYFIRLQRGVRELVDAGTSAEGILAAGPELAARLRTIPNIARYVPSDFWFKAQVEKVSADLRADPAHT